MSIKSQYGDEIARALAEAIGSDIIKEASGSALDAYKTTLAGVVDENGLKEAWNKHQDALNQEESTNEALKLQADKARELGIPGYSTPMADDCCPMCGHCGHRDEKEEPVEMEWDDKTSMAANFVMNKLVKIADTLDNKGFTSVANVIDEAVKKIASKKN